MLDLFTELSTVKSLYINMKENLKRYQLKHNTELFNIDLNFIKDTITYCTKKNALLIKKILKWNRSRRII